MVILLIFASTELIFIYAYGRSIIVIHSKVTVIVFSSTDFIAVKLAIIFKVLFKLSSYYGVKGKFNS